MKLQHVRWYEMLARVDDFGVARAERFPATSLGGELFAVVGTSVGDAKTYGVANDAGNSDARERTSAKARLRKALRTLMLALCRTARAVAAEVPGLDQKFRMPLTQVAQRFITAARTMVQEAAPHADRFVAHGLPPTFLADLTAAADTFAGAIQEHAAAKEARAAAAAGVVETLAKGFAAAKRLDAVVKNMFAGDPQTLAAWKTARHVSKLGLTSPAAKAPATEPPSTPKAAPSPTVQPTTNRAM